MDLFLFRMSVLVVALFFDLMGEPPEKIHPVVWMGKIIRFFEKRISSYRRFFGFIVLLFVSIMFVLPFFLIPPTILWILPSAFFAKTMFSLKSLLRMVEETSTSDLNKKRTKIDQLVSRDTKELKEEHLNSAAIETAVENFTDSVIGPIFYFILFGLPGIVFYRVTNTMDAMVGYKDDRHKDFGNFPARLDDFLNFIPTRFAACLLVLVSRKTKAFKTIKKYRNIKLNPGWTISAISGILNRRIEKEGSYDINPCCIYPQNNDILKTLSLIKKTFLVFISGVIILLGVLSYLF